MKRLAAISLLLLCGCVSAYKGGTISDGTSLVIGLKTPITSTGTTTLQILSYVNGLIVSWENNVNVEIRRSQTESLNAFGIWQSSKTNHTDMIVTQCGTNTVEEARR